MTFANEEEDDQQSTNAAVPIEEWVQCLELIMEQRATDQRWHAHTFVNESLPVRQPVLHLFVRRGDVDRVRWGVTSDPVRRLARFAGRALLSTHATNDDGVDALQQSPRN